MRNVLSMPMNFVTLTLAGMCPMRNVFVYSWSNKHLCDLISGSATRMCHPVYRIEDLLSQRFCTYGRMAPFEMSQYSGMIEPGNVNSLIFRADLPLKNSCSSSSFVCSAANSSVVVITGTWIALMRDNVSGTIFSCPVI